MVVYHLKYSYLNWKAIPYRKRIDCVYAIFIFNTFWICLSWFSLGLNRISQVHDMTIKFLFFCFFLFLYPQDLSAPSNDACHRWPSRLKHHFSCGNYFEKVCLLVKGLFIPFLSVRKGCSWKGCLYRFCQQKRVMAQRVVHIVSISKKRLSLKGLSSTHG